jgi:hypothetical protein
VKSLGRAGSAARPPFMLEMKKIHLIAGPMAGMFVFVAGCNIGNAPAGPSPADVQKIESSLPVDKQIKLIESSPMPAAEKAKRIAALKGGASPDSTPVSGNPAVNKP